MGHLSDKVALFFLEAYFIHMYCVALFSKYKSSNDPKFYMFPEPSTEFGLLWWRARNMFTLNFCMENSMQLLNVSEHYICLWCLSLAALIWSLLSSGVICLWNGAQTFWMWLSRTECHLCSTAEYEQANSYPVTHLDTERCHCPSVDTCTYKQYQRITKVHVYLPSKISYKYL